MLGFLAGKIIEGSADGKALVWVGSSEHGGVGYSVTVPQGPAYLNCLPGARVEFHLYSHVREDAFDLYGFLTRGEKELFLTLLSVNGIGPKLAIGILSRVEPEHLIHAILEGDQESLKRIPGIGKKTAERVILELRDSVAKKVEAGSLTLKKREAPPGRSSLSGDAKAALVGLGYKEPDAKQMVERVLSELDVPPTQVEQVIRMALRQVI